MVRNWLLSIFGLSEIVAQQAFVIDKLRMQCIESDLYYKLFEMAELWEPNDVY